MVFMAAVRRLCLGCINILQRFEIRSEPISAHFRSPTEPLINSESHSVPTYIQRYIYNIYFHIYISMKEVMPSV